MDVLLDISLSPDQRGWLALVIAMSCIGYLLFRKKVKKDPLGKPASFGTLAQERSTERQMQNLLVELSEMSRHMSAQIDTRAAKLEQLIKDADERIATLRNIGASPSSSAPELVGTPTSPQLPVELPPVEQEQVPPVIEEPVFEPDPRHVEIYSLADQGQGIKEIATRTGQPTGEIELILALRPRV